MAWVDISIPQSSQIAQVEYDEEAARLRVSFQRGGVYEYDGVPPDVVAHLSGASSLGKTFNSLVKNNYVYTKIA